MLTDSNLIKVENEKGLDVDVECKISLIALLGLCISDRNLNTFHFPIIHPIHALCFCNATSTELILFAKLLI